MIIRLLSNTFFILTFITSSGIFGYFGDLQYLEIPNFPNIRMLSLAFGYYERQLAFGDKDRFLYNDNADNIWRAPTLRLPKGNLIQQPQQLVSTTFRGNQLPAAVGDLLIVNYKDHFFRDLYTC